MPARRRPLTATQWLRGKLLIATAVVVYLASLAGTFYTIDFAYYQPAKWELISRSATSQNYIDAVSARNLAASFSAWVESRRAPGPPSAVSEARFEESKRYATQLADLSPAVTRVTLEDQSGNILFEAARSERLALLNSHRNSLFYRGFERAIQRQFSIESNDERLWRFRIHLTSPINDPQVAALTSYYWRMIGLAFVSLTTVLLGLIRWVLGPLSRVTALMQDRSDGVDQFIAHPRSPIERSYNELARDAALTRFSKELRDYISAGGYSYAEPVLEHAPSLLRSIIGLSGCEIHTFTRRRSEPWVHERRFSDGEDLPGTEALPAQLSELLGTTTELDPYHWSARVHSWVPPRGAPTPFFCDLLMRTPDRLWVLVIHRTPGDSVQTPWWNQFLGRVAQELRYALDSIEEQRRLILQEKSKANISLSRNLGHDLTNIIATSKLELMTVRTFLSLPAAEISANPMKERIFRESLEALLNNTRFLQEIVNLYRSFSFLQKPKFEQVDVSELVADIVKLYRPSLSKDFDFDLRLAKDLPPVRLEPRLLRLALFNLLTNATEAIRRASGDDKAKGRIILTTALCSDRAGVEITVADTGPGIRDSEGRLKTDASLTEIFRLGYSTKKNQEGEGLGLNWVQSIVREFHGGEITASNREEGGAAFTLKLPMEAPSSASNDHNPTTKTQTE